MLDAVKAINKAQLGSKKPVVQKDSVRYDWEDGSLLGVLSTGVDYCVERQVNDGDRESERQAVRKANSIIATINDGYEYSVAEERFDQAISQASGYIAKRLSDMKHRVIDDAMARKGVLVYGEGGIGKTRFLYELTSELDDREREYAIAFDWRGVNQLYEVGVKAIAESCPKGFTLIIDACNELEDSVFTRAEEMITTALLLDDVSVAVTTRSESPKSRIEVLKKALPCSRRFEGVDPYMVFDLVSEYPDEILIQYQDMLMSNNPRNLNAMLYLISSRRFKDDSRNAVTKRTALIEECVRDSMSKEHWMRTKLICKYLYDARKTTFTFDEAYAVLGEAADEYLSDMVSQGFLAKWDWDLPTYAFASESQMQFLIARNLNGDLNALVYKDVNTTAFANEVACLVADKSAFMNQQEMVQVAVDRYCGHGIELVMQLLKSFDEAEVAFDWERVLVQTIFPAGSDFSSVTASSSLDPTHAFLHFAGVLNTPFNLTNYANAKLVRDTHQLDTFYLRHWETWKLSELIQRVRCVAEYVGRAGAVPDAAREEWTWLAIWSSMSGNRTLRALGQRLMFAVCDSCVECVSLICDAWQMVDDVYVKRAIAKTLSMLDCRARDRVEVTDLLDSALGDADLTDSIAMTFLSRIRYEGIALPDFNSRNWYEELGEMLPDAEDSEAFERLIWRVDIENRGYIPFDLNCVERGKIDLGYGDRFASTPKQIIKDWNSRLGDMLACSADGECKGLYVRPEEFAEFLPVEFDVDELDRSKLLNAIIELTRRWYSEYGGTLVDGLGRFISNGYERDSLSNPNLKPLDLAIHSLLGSLSANYYTKDILLGDSSPGHCGFRPYEELMYEEPGNTHSFMPVPSVLVDNVKSKISSRIVSPEEQDDEWFNDIHEMKEELFALIAPVKAGGQIWRPLALDARYRIRDGANLLRSNEAFISVGFNPVRHIDGGRDDRYLTIEHRDYVGNMKDYPLDATTVCLYMPEPDEDCSVRKKNAMLLPPPLLVRELNLTYRPKTGCFVDESTGEDVIVCDGNPASYYEDPVCDLMLIRDDVFAELVKTGKLVYFAFTERFKEGTGYGNMCDRHWEFSPDGAQWIHFPNEQSAYDTLVVPEECRECYFSSANRRERSRRKNEGVEYRPAKWLEELLNKYSLASSDESDS